MKSRFQLLLILSVFFIIEGCNTLYNTRLIDIEIVEPGKFLLPEKYTNAAMRYNNANIAFNPSFAVYYEEETEKKETSNTDSIAAEIYFYSFFEQLQKQIYFDSIVEISPRNFKDTYFINDSEKIKTVKTDSILTNNEENSNYKTASLTNIITSFQPQNQKKPDTLKINPEFGLYTKKELKEIADSTGADLLISLDYFTTIDNKTFQKVNFEYQLGSVTVYSTAFWNFYNLKKQELEFFYDHVDTLMWEATGNYLKEITSVLPPRKDAILNAADISGERLANMVVPHWNKVQRLYYQSGHYELKLTEKLVNNGNWLEAAKIWKANINNPNKKIAAKCMFNLAVACEMEGDLEAAIDWTVKSFYIFNNKNIVHSENCQDYLNILAQRKLDFKRIEIQLKPESDKIKEK